MKKPWHDQYDKFVPRSLLYSNLNIPQVLDRSVQNYPEQICLCYMDRSITYQQVAEASDNLAKWLSFLGCEQDDRIGLIFPNSPQFVIAFFAILKMGGIVVAMNPMYKAPEFTCIIDECDVKCILCMEDLVPLIQSLSLEHPIQRVITSSSQDFSTISPDDTITQKMILDKDVVSIDPVMQFNDCLGTDIANIELDYTYSADRPAVFQYSGGTTGTPKAAIGLHRNIVANTMQFLTWCDLQPLEETFLAAIPLYHVYGMVLALVLGIRLAARIVLIPNTRDIENLLESISDGKVTFFPGVPNIYATIIRYPAVQEGKYDLSSIKACISGSAPLHPHIKESFEKLTGGKLVEGYGLSEAPTATHCNPLYGKNKIGSFGLPLPDVDCKIVDVEDDTKLVKDGSSGELLIKGPQIMNGYFNNNYETQLALKNGWLHTGDIVRMDEEGYFYFVDRKKDLIKVGGFQVWPNEIEAVLNAIEGVKTAVVAGEAEDTGDEKVIAWLVLEEGEKVEVEQVLEHCRKNLAAYKIPREIIFVPEIPRTGVGKVLRRELIRQYKEKRS
ncbi:MAG TPA: long-chain fatty acid--CoA ligase [Anaerolineaceae bacterium]|uniref:Long-chain fatty-acid-CoA ligase n=1 Tax=Anaerolinea thermophila TaxID=167964 RepID=A0A101FZ96_9CHLR|nr:MAG: Long-chain fatty-acid-CoA ligase [Anaerolinea thermophila]HAF61076.1 long-chain fatty acid--CoA ligase [Anaerolineaceae bacterium]